jgi:type III restriction enzyme
MNITPFHAKYLGHDLTRRCASDRIEKLASVLSDAQVDLNPHQIERHIRKDRDEGANRLRKDVQLSLEFQALWERIKPKTTYRVEFETNELVTRAVAVVRQMEKIEPATIRMSAGQIGMTKGGVPTTAINVAEEQVPYGDGPVPDGLAYLQNETELTRSTVASVILRHWARRSRLRCQWMRCRC